MEQRSKVFFSCSGVGILNRGIETFFREAFDALRETEGLDITLLKGAGEPRRGERLLWNIPRTSRTARLLGRCVRRNGYVVEQLTTFPSMARAIRAEQPDIIFYSDSNLGFQLYRWRKQIGVPFKLLFSNGGPCHAPFNRTDFVHQVAPLYLEEALQAGEPADKHFLVPYGIRVCEPPKVDVESKRAMRRRLELPLDKPVVLSVGWIARQHKRMHYVVEEIARLSQPRPFLQLLGAMDEASAEILELGNRLLGPSGFAAASVPYECVADYYRAADCFVLGSLQEGFGRVYLEALMRGLPVIAHRHPVIEWVVGPEGTFGDLSRPGELAELLTRVLKQPVDPEGSRRRWHTVRGRFGWPTLVSEYRAMFQTVAGRDSLRGDRVTVVS